MKIYHSIKLEEIKRQDSLEKKQREEDKEQRRQQFAHFVRNSGAIVDNRELLEAQKQELLAERRQKETEWEQHFDGMMTEMMKRVIRRPLLVEAGINFCVSNINAYKTLENCSLQRRLQRRQTAPSRQPSRREQKQRLG